MKNLKQFIFKKMEEQGYILDQELYKFCGREPNFSTAEIYKREYLNFKNAKEYFKDFKNPILSHYKKRYSIGHKGINEWWKIPKSYFLYLKSQGIKEE
jgi:hypothetical protein